MTSARAELQDLLPRSQRQRLLLRLLRYPAHRQLRRLLTRVHPADIAPLFPLLTPHDQQRLMEILFELRLAGSTLRELDPETQRRALDNLPDNRLAVVLGRLSADDAVDLLARLEPDRRRQLLNLVDPSLAKRLTNLLRYGEATAGGLMNPEVAIFLDDQTVGETLKHIRQMAGSGRLFYVYVTDHRGHLIGIASLWQLVVSESRRKLREILTTEVVSVQVDTPREEVARVFSRYDLLMVPVVDEDGRLVGVITVDDVLDVIQEEATEDLYRLANLDTQDSLATPATRSVRLRLPWLLLSVASGLIIAAVVKMFEPTLHKYVLLAAFMPVVPLVGGNAGTQTLTVMVRALAVGDMDLRRVLSVVFKQMGIGLLNGLAAGVGLGAIAWLWEGSPALGGILVFSMVVNLVVAALMGASVPLVLWRLKLDPALGSSIFVSTATDVTGYMVFLASATILIQTLQ